MLLDSEEYLHLAIHATQNQQHHAALDYLHKCLEQEPNNAKATFLLAAEYAELGLRKRSILCMTRALELDPELEMARYQLGLLHVQEGNVEESQEIWAHLAEFSQEPAIRLVSQGLAMIESDYQMGLTYVKQATEAETTNGFLKSSIEAIHRNLAEAGSMPAAPPLGAETSRVLFLDAYRNSDFQEDN